MPESYELKEILERLLSRDATDADVQTLRRALHEGSISMAGGTRSVAIGKSADNANIFTGDGNLLFSFSGPDAGVIREALSKVPRDTSRPQIPSDLPYLCNREDQELDLESALKAHAALDDTADNKSRNDKSWWPVVCILHGSKFEGHDAFIQRVQKLALPRMLRSAYKRSVKQPELKLLRWPKVDCAGDDALQEFKRELNASIDWALANSSSKTPLLLQTSIDSENCTGHGGKLIAAYVDCWRNRKMPVGRIVIACLCLKYQKVRNPLRRRKVARLNRELKNHIEGLQAGGGAAYADLHSAVLRELSSIPRDAAENWGRLEQVRSFWRADIEQLLEEIGRIYERGRPWRLFFGRKRIPMQLLAPQLMKLLQKGN